MVSLDQQVRVVQLKACYLFLKFAIGIVIVTETQALLWTDGRYHLQASKELDLTVWTLMRQGSIYIHL